MAKNDCGCENECHKEKERVIFGERKRDERRKERKANEYVSGEMKKR